MRISTVLMAAAFLGHASLGHAQEAQRTSGSANPTSTAAPAPAPASAPPASAPARPPLEALASKPILMLPVQYLSFGDTLGWSKRLPAEAKCLDQFDSLVTARLREYRLPTWRFPDDITHAAKRNAGFVADPHAISANALRFGKKPPQYQLGEPLASQLRSLIALGDARHVFIPIELRTVNRGGKGQLMARVAVIDARGSQVEWIGEVGSRLADQWSDALLADVANGVAALIIGTD